MAISDYILSQNGIIYGVKFDENMAVVHARAESKEERDKFKGSKYVQSDLTGIFEKISNDLKDGRNVLFTGTPCQCSGLKSYIGKNQENLFLCDLVCHGTPSPLIWHEHVKAMENKYKSKLVEFYFRSKVNGWHKLTNVLVFKNGKTESKSLFSQAFMKLFLSNFLLRPSCHNCKYTNLQRCSDITIADFWGIDKHMPDFDDNRGVSLMLINTEKGKQIFENIEKNLDYRKSDTESCMQTNLKQPTKPSPKRNDFWRDYHKKGYLYVAKKYTKQKFKKRIKSIIVKILIKIKIYLKKILRKQ